jgi:hypothetical protein
MGDNKLAQLVEQNDLGPKRLNVGNFGRLWGNN